MTLRLAINLVVGIQAATFFTLLALFLAQGNWRYAIAQAAIGVATVAVYGQS